MSNITQTTVLLLQYSDQHTVASVILLSQQVMIINKTLIQNT